MWYLRAPNSDDKTRWVEALERYKVYKHLLDLLIIGQDSYLWFYVVYSMNLAMAVKVAFEDMEVQYLFLPQRYLQHPVPVFLKTEG